MSLRESVRLVTRRISCWAPIGLTDEQQLIDVRLHAAGSSIDVNSNNVIVSLVPLTIAIGHDGISAGRLEFVDRSTGRELGTLHLRRAASESTRVALAPGYSILEVCGGSHACLPPGLRTWHRIRQANWRRKPGFHMSNTAIQRLTLFYICPRPVVLVSVDDGVNDNLFPMDLIGRLGDRFTLALRSTSASIATMHASRRVALADVALRLQDTVYGLGKHHRLKQIDWDELPFATARSPEFGLRVPADAQRVRECTIESWREVGSHQFFMCRAVSDRTLGNEPRLHHTSGIHRTYRARRGSLPWYEARDLAASN